MRRGIASVSLLMLLALAGCATGVADPRDDTGDEMRACYPGHKPPSTIAVVVYVDSVGVVQVVPNRVVVEHPNQTVIWTAADGEISDITFEPSDCAPGPPTIKGKGRQLSARIAAGHRGTHKYGFTFHPTRGEAQVVDPLIVIEY